MNITKGVLWKRWWHVIFVMEISLLSHFCDYLFADAGYALLELFKWGLSCLHDKDFLFSQMGQLYCFSIGMVSKALDACTQFWFINMYVSMSVPEQGKPFGFGIMKVISFLRNLICRDRIGLQWMDRTACTHLPKFLLDQDSGECHQLCTRKRKRASLTSLLVITSAKLDTSLLWHHHTLIALCQKETMYTDLY